MKAFLALALVLGTALAQPSLRGITPQELEGVLQEMGIPHEPTQAKEYRLEMAGLEKVWLYLDYCQDERCGVLILSAGFTLEDPPGLDLLNAWNRDRRFSRAFLDEERAVWVESDLDLTGGVSLGAVKAFLELFAQEILPDFMEHIGFEP